MQQPIRNAALSSVSELMHCGLSALERCAESDATEPEVHTLLRALLERFGALSADEGSLAAATFFASVARAPWPSDLRELRDYLERCLVLDKELPMTELDNEREPKAYSSPPSGSPIEGALSYEEARKQAIAAFERSYLEGLLDRSHGNVSRAARDAGMDRVYLHRLIRRHALR